MLIERMRYLNFYYEISPDAWSFKLSRPWWRATNPSDSAEKNTTAGRDVPVNPRSNRALWTGTGTSGAELVPHSGDVTNSFESNRVYFGLRRATSGTLGLGRETIRGAWLRLSVSSKLVASAHLNMASTTCTRFTDEYQLYEELGK